MSYKIVRTTTEDPHLYGQPGKVGRPPKYPFAQLEKGESFIEAEKTPKKLETLRSQCVYHGRKLGRRFAAMLTSKGIEVKRFS